MAPAAHRDGAAPETPPRRVFHFGKGRSDGNKAMKDLVLSCVITSLALSIVIVKCTRATVREASITDMDASLI